MYMSINKDKACHNGTQREHSISSDNRYLKHSYTGGKKKENQYLQHLLPSQKGSANDYEIVFDHMNDESMPDHPSYDMEE